MCWTTTTGTGRSAGRAGSTVASASGPPVELPIASTPKGPVRGRRTDGRAGGGGGVAVAAPRRRVPVSALSLGMSCSRMFFCDSAKLPTFDGFVT